MLDFFRGDRPWSQFYRLLDRLPAWGHYKTQLVMDEEWARFIVDEEEKNRETPPTGEEIEDEDTISPLGYSPGLSRLDLILDRLQSLEATVAWTANTKEQRRQIRPMPKPETALDRERQRRTRSLLEEVDAMFRGDGLFLTFE